MENRKKFVISIHLISLHETGKLNAENHTECGGLGSWSCLTIIKSSSIGSSHAQNSPAHALQRSPHIMHAARGQPQQPYSHSVTQASSYRLYPRLAICAGIYRNGGEYSSHAAKTES